MSKWTVLQNRPTVGVTSGGYKTVTPVSGNVTIDLSHGANQRLVLSATAVTILAPIFSGTVITAGMSMFIYLDQDTTGDRAVPTFTGGAHGFVSSTGSQVQIDGTASTRSSLSFTFHGTYWSLDSQTTGATTS